MGYESIVGCHLFYNFVSQLTDRLSTGQLIICIIDGDFENIFR